MGVQMSVSAGPAAHENTCRLVIGKERSLAEILQFVIAGLEVGQQVVVMAGASCLKEIARGLAENALRPEALLHSNRLVFLTAPNCLSELLKRTDPLRRSPLHPNGSMMRWVSDWSWAYSNGSEPGSVLEHQRRIHEFIRPFNALSLCTVHCEKLGRGSLLALLADHRRATRATAPQVMKRAV